MEKLLDIKNLVVRYKTDESIVEALNSVSLSIEKGKTLGLVGETGSGKTTLAKTIIQLIPSPPGEILEGEIIYNNKDLLKISQNELRNIRGKEISMIFQDPMTALNPVMTVGEQIAETIAIHEKLSERQAMEKAYNMLETVGISPERAGEYPHQFSGGMKQRVIIAIALACNPSLLIADEPTTALDVTIQAQVLELMRNLKNEFNTSMLMITHDLGVVAQNCDYVAIIYAGEIVEYGELKEIFHNYKHPYTEGLFGSIPSLTETVKRLDPIKGLMPDPSNLPKGCKFNPRCKYAEALCLASVPPLYSIGGGHQVRCIRYREENREGAE